MVERWLKMGPNWIVEETVRISAKVDVLWLEKILMDSGIRQWEKNQTSPNLQMCIICCRLWEILGWKLIYLSLSSSFPGRKSFIVEKLKSPTEQLKTTEFAEFNNPHSKKNAQNKNFNFQCRYSMDSVRPSVPIFLLS